MTLFACSGTGKKEFSITSVIKGNSGTSKISTDKIDNENTYEIYFKLEKNIDCIRFSFTSDIILDKFKLKKNIVKTYFVVDQTVDISKFKTTGNANIFTEIGKNFNQQWLWKKFITICPEDNNPIFQLDKNILYRIRFTIFKPENFDYKAYIYSNCRVTVMKSGI